jgi:hypothetical protein
MARARSALEAGPISRRRALRPGRSLVKVKTARAATSARPVERRYRQVVRRVDLWSVLKVSVCFYLCALVVSLGAGVVLWTLARGAGAIDNVEGFMEDLGFEDFEFLSWRILRAATLIGLVLSALATILTVLAAAFYNLFSELVGGIEITVVEEE